MVSLFLVSAADNSKDLATELVHYGFIHEVSFLPLLLISLVRAPCDQAQSPNLCDTSRLRGAGAPPSPIQQPESSRRGQPAARCGARSPCSESPRVLFCCVGFFSPLHAWLRVAVLRGQSYCDGRANYINLTVVLNVRTRGASREGS